MAGFIQEVDANIQDQHTELVDLHLTQKIDDITITVNTSLDDKTVTFDSDTAPTVGNVLCLKESTAFYQGEILSYVDNGGGGYTATVDNPLDFAFTTNGGCSIRTQGLNVNGSVTPQIFSVSPSGLVDPGDLVSGQKWDIVRFMISITDATAMDDGKFGSIAGGLTNGIVIRKKNGTYKNIFNAKTNGDLRLHTFDVNYIDDTFGPAGLFGLGCRRTFGGQSKNGVVVRLDADDNDEFQIIVQDDLTGLESFQVAVQGHIVEV